MINDILAGKYFRVRIMKLCFSLATGEAKNVFPKTSTGREKHQKNPFLQKSLLSLLSFPSDVVVVVVVLSFSCRCFCCCPFLQTSLLSLLSFPSDAVAVIVVLTVESQGTSYGSGNRASPTGLPFCSHFDFLLVFRYDR